MFSVGKGSHCTSSWREDFWGLLDISLTDG